jgi:hypothetical protein
MTSLSPAIQSVLDLFQGPLSSVRFADIDATGLASAATEVTAAASEVERQEATLAELKQGLAQRQEALLVLAQQALAYARVYAENDEPLLEELNRISLPRAAKPRKPGATKASGTRDNSPEKGRAETSNEALGNEALTDDGTEAAPARLLDEDAESEAASETVDAPPVRNSRKGRGSSAQRATP